MGRGKIVSQFYPDAVILFGSRATGTFDADSDYDLCILKSDVEHRRGMAQDMCMSLAGTGVAIDLIVESPMRCDEMKGDPNMVYSGIAAHGEVLYERP